MSLLIAYWINNLSLLCKSKNIFSFPFTAKGNARCYTMKITIILLYSSNNCLFILLYNGLCVQLRFLIYLCVTLIYICCGNQYSLIRKIQYRTILSILCRRLVGALLPNTILISKISSLLPPLLSYHNISLVQVFNDICTHLMYTSDRF